MHCSLQLTEMTFDNRNAIPITEIENENQFEITLNTLQLQDGANCESEFIHEFESKTKTHMILENLRSSLEAWIKKLNSSVNINTKNRVIFFDLVSELIEKLNNANIEIVLDSDINSTPECALVTINNIVQSELSLYSTAYKFNKNIRLNSSYVHPEEKAIGNRFEMKRCPESSLAVPRLIPSTFQFVSITKTLKSLFANEQFRSLYLAHNAEGDHVCIDGLYKHFCCGSIYKKNDLFRNDRYALQIQIYTDDFEVCNPLQSKAGIHKLCAVYFQIKNLPVRVQSKLNSIFLVSLCHSDDVHKSSQSDYNNIWEVIVQDLRQLETEGIDIGSMKIRGTVCWPSFDNLGANTSLGFAGGFNTAYYCRFCECDSTECKTLNEELPSKIRNREKYASCLKIIESLEKVDFRQTLGVKRYCALNDLQYFHITENISADILHDIYEGAMPFVLKHLIQFMLSSKILKKNEIVGMVSFFDYGQQNQRNKPSILAVEKSNMGQNGSQSKCLFNNFPFICAKFENDENLKRVWRNFETLARISQIIHSSEIGSNHLNELEDAVSELLNSIQIDFNVNLIPKLHNLLHYARIVRSMGPVVHMNTHRYESKHKELKFIVHQSPNFQNICKTIALRCQQDMSISDFGLNNAIVLGAKHLLNVLYEDDEYLFNALQNHSAYVTKSLRCNNFEYKTGLFIIHDTLLLEIKKILLIDTEIFFYCVEYELTQFVSFYNSYKVRLKSPPQNLLLPFEKFEIIKPWEKKVVNGEYYLIAETLAIRQCICDK